MTGPGKRLMVVTVACVLIGLAAVVAAWRDPDGGFTVLATTQFGTTEHDGFRGPCLSENTPKPHSRGQAGGPCSRTVRSATLISEGTPEAPLALGRRVDRSCSARGAPGRALVVELDDVGSRGTGNQGAWARSGASASELDDPPRRTPLQCISACAVRRRQSSAGANPARQLSLQPVAIGADGGGNDIRLKHSDATGRLGRLSDHTGHNAK